MILMARHGGDVRSVCAPAQSAQDMISKACGFTPSETAPDAATAEFGRFGYFFPDGASTPPRPEIAADLDRLGDAMIDTAGPDEDNSGVPAFFTYLGQFVDHDITAGTDRETGFSQIDVSAADLAQHAKRKVAAGLVNLRTGAPDLDSLYGGAAHMSTFGRVLQDAMRFPADRAKMFLGTSSIPDPSRADCRPPLPRDPATDLLRVGRLVDPADPILPAAAFDALTGDLADRFRDVTGALVPARAVIGDMRNDENLAVAQTHLMFLRLHNKIVDASVEHVVDQSDREAVFQWARQQTRRIYQWLLINDYLPRICDTGVLADVLAGGAPVYARFLRASGPGAQPAMMPIPLEFSVAAFRFGHTQARADYDWNVVFGRGATTCNPSADRARFNLFFAFTGEGDPPMLGQSDRLPSNWICDMERFLNAGPIAYSDRNTRRIDPCLAPDLLNMPHLRPGARANMRNLPIRNLRRGHLLNIPTAQACIAALADQGVEIDSLAPSDIASGTTGEAVRQGGFDTATPLWFYILKEADILSNGRCLGPLGSRIVAETLAGLVIHGADSYWADLGSDQGRWHPRDAVCPDGIVVDSFPNMMRAVGYL